MTAMDPDVVVVGSGPNGLVAAALMARAGWSVEVLEQADVPGGAVHSEATTDGFVHDTCSAFYGVLHASPVFAELDLARRVAWAHFAAPVAAAVSPEDVAVMGADPQATAAGLGPDGPAWSEFVGWWGHVGQRFLAACLAPLPSLGPLLRLGAATGVAGGLELARTMLGSIEALARDRFVTARGCALLACGASHADLSVDAAGSAPGPLILAGVAQTQGMPVPVGGAGRLAEALADCVREAGGIITTGVRVTGVVAERGRAVGVETSAGPLGARRAVLADTDAVTLFGELVEPGLLPGSFMDRLRRVRRGTGVFRLDLALDRPAPWAAEALRSSGVVHLCGDLSAMASAADGSRHGRLPDAPMLVVGQQSLADPSRAPAGHHTLWVETQVPPTPPGGWAAAGPGFEALVTRRLEAHAPGLEAAIVGRARRTPDDLAAENPNLVGGDVGGGSMALDQQLVFRPVGGWFRYRTPVRGLYLCSASAHPGGGVHGMVGRNCARRVLRDGRRGRLARR